MRLLVVVVAIALPASAASAPAPDSAGQTPIIDPGLRASGDCPPISRFHASRKSGGLTAQKLAELPAADMYLTVYRRIGGCEVPIIARYGIGADAPNSR